MVEIAAKVTHPGFTPVGRETVPKFPTREGTSKMLASGGDIWRIAFQ
jgi:hypothetical protein